MQYSKRKLSNDLKKPNVDQLKHVFQVLKKVRPSSGQPMSTSKQISPFRKPLFSGTAKNRLTNDINNVEQQQPVLKLEKDVQFSSQKSQTLKQNQQQSFQIKSLQNLQKPPIPKDKNIGIKKQELLLNCERNVQTVGETKTRNNSQNKIQSAGAKTNKFIWNCVIGQTLQRKTSLNKAIKESKEILKHSPSISPQTPKELQIKQAFRLKKQNFNPDFNNLPKLVNNKQPKCYVDFSITSRPNELSCAFALIQKEIKQASLEGKQKVQENQLTYMNAIPEQEDDGCLSFAYSTHKQFK